MNQHLLRSARLLFIGLDVSILNLMLFLGKSWYDDYIPIKYDIQYFHLVVFLNIAWVGISWLKNLYQKKYILSFERFCRETMHAYVYFISLLILYLYFYRKIEISRLFIGVELIAIAIGFFFNR